MLAITSAHRGQRVAALRAHAGDQQGQGGRELAHPFNLRRVGGAHHQTQLAVHVPRALRQLRHMLVQQGLAGHTGQALALQIVAAGVGGAAQQKSAFARVRQVGLHRIKTHEGRERDRIGPIALKGLDGVLLGGAANVAALGVQNDRHRRGIGPHVVHQALQLRLSAVSGEVGNLGFEGDHQISGGVNDAGAKVKNMIRPTAPSPGQLGRVWIQPHAQQRLVGPLGCV